MGNVSHIPDRSRSVAATGALGLAGTAALQAVEAVAPGDIRRDGAGSRARARRRRPLPCSSRRRRERSTGSLPTCPVGARTPDFVRSLGAVPRRRLHRLICRGQVRRSGRTASTPCSTSRAMAPELGELLMPAGWLASTLIMSLEQLPVPNAKVSPIFAVSDAATLDRLAMEVLGRPPADTDPANLRTRTGRRSIRRLRRRNQGQAGSFDSLAGAGEQPPE